MSGYAWAFRYDFIKNVKMFEHNIIGGGDRITASALIGLPYAPITVAGINNSPYFEYLKKAKEYGANRDSVGYISGAIFDLFHGFHLNRQYEERHSILKDVKFNTETDLIFVKDQPYKFAPHVNSDTKSRILEYFYSRSEL